MDKQLPTIASARRKVSSLADDYRAIIDALGPFWRGEVNFGSAECPDTEFAGAMMAGVKLAEEIVIRTIMHRHGLSIKREEK